MSNQLVQEYRGKAEECRQQAMKAISPSDKAAWLRMAEDWQRLAESIEDKPWRRAESSEEPAT
jgi:hypothetical protein